MKHPSERLRSRASRTEGLHPQPKDEATHRIHSLFRLRMLASGCEAERASPQGQLPQPKDEATHRIHSLFRLRKDVRRADLALVLGLTLAVGALSPWFPGIGSGNEQSRIYLTEALLVDGTVAIDGAMARHGQTGDKSVRAGRHYSDKAPGTSLVALPAVALYRAMVATPTLAGQLRAARIAASVLPTLLLLWVLLGWLREVVDGGTARALVVACALGSLGTTYGTLLFGHQLAAVCVLLAFLSTRRLRAGPVGAPLGAPVQAAAVSAGFFAGLAVLTEYTTVLYMLPIGVAFVWWSRRRPALVALALAGAALPIATLLLYHQAAFGHPLRTGYDFLVNPYFAGLHTAGWRGFGWPRFERLGVHFLSPRKGLFFYAPWLVLAVPGVWALWRGRAKSGVPGTPGAPTPGDTPVVLGVVLISVLALLAMPNDHGGWTLGQRYLTGAVPWLAWLVAAALGRWPRLRPVFVAGVLVALVLTGLATAVFPFYPEHGQHPTMQFGLVFARAGVDGGSLWQVLGLGSLLGASLVAGAAALGLVWWLRRWGSVAVALGLAAGLLWGVARMRPDPGPVGLRDRILERILPAP